LDSGRRPAPAVFFNQIRLRGMVSISGDGRPAMINPAYDLVRS